MSRPAPAGAPRLCGADIGEAVTPNGGDAVLLGADIERAIAEITASRDYKRRLPEATGGVNSGIARVVNALLAEVEARDNNLQVRLDQLVDARDDAQTANLMLRRLKEDLGARKMQLDGALQKAAAASSAKSQFLANMSHEIRTPMNGILGMAELLRRTTLDAKQRQQVNTIVHSGRALLQIINDILDFSKIESGKFDLDPKPFDLTMCLADIVELLRPTANGKSLALTLDIDPALPRSYVGDAGRIRQIVMNLSGNAVKFTDRGSVTLKLTGETDGERMALQIQIIDTGIGIPAEKLGDVFEKFSQVDETGSRRHEGTGLGLSISQLLAGRMDGDISAASELGRGSVFSFRLKLPAHVEAARETTDSVDLAGKRIAIFGDSCDADAACETLKQSGCAIIGGAHLEDAAAADAGIDAIVAFDVAVSDQVLRRLSALRAATRDGAAPIIVCVMTGAPGDARRVTAVGAQGYLCGAFDAGQLVKALQRVLLAARQTAKGAADGGSQAVLVTRHSLAEQAPAQKAPETAAAPAQNFKVLVVDDSLVNQEVAREFLEELLCDVAIAGNGEQAVKATAEVRYDLIMMDCQMPVMDGFQATAAIRARHTGATICTVPIVALTANAFASDREKCLASGMSDFLSKPFMPSDFEAVVKRWLPQQTGQRLNSI